MNNDDFTVLVTGVVVDATEWAHVLCGLAFKITELSNEPASNFALSFNIPLWKLFGLSRRAQLWATSDWQLHHDNAPAHAPHLMQSILVKHQITRVTQPHYSPDVVPCDFWLFPKLNSPLRGERFQTIDEIQENTTGQMMATGRTVWGPKEPTLKGLRRHCPVYNVSCILYLFNKCLYFSYYMAGYLLDRLRMV